MKLVRLFLMGILGAVGALILETIALIFFAPALQNAEILSSFSSSLNYFFFFAIITEEFFKYLLICKSVPRISEGKNMAFGSLIFGLGFSVPEVIFIYWSFQNGGSFSLEGILGIIIIHISTSIIMGYAISKNFNNILMGFVFGFFPAFLIHSAYNILLISEVSRQKQLITAMLSAIIILDIFLLFSQKIGEKTEAI
jgi:hypothetical protein